MQSTNKRLILPGIYRFVSKTTGLSYIGQSLYLLDRKRSHFHQVYKEKRERKWHQAVLSLGYKDFQWEILFTIDHWQHLTEQEILDILNPKEIELIAKYNSYKNGYNSTKGGGRTVRRCYAGMTLEEKEEAQKKYWRNNQKIRQSKRTPEEKEEAQKKHSLYMVDYRKGEKHKAYRTKLRETSTYKEYHKIYMKELKSTSEYKIQHKIRKMIRDRLKNSILNANQTLEALLK